MRNFLATICFGCMLALIAGAVVLGSNGIPEGAGLLIACAALFMAAGVTFRRGE